MGFRLLACFFYKVQEHRFYVAAIVNAFGLLGA